MLPVLLLPIGLIWTWSLLVAPVLPMNRSVRAGFDGSGSTAIDCTTWFSELLLATKLELPTGWCLVYRPPGRCGWPRTGRCRAG